MPLLSSESPPALVVSVKTPLTARYRALQDEAIDAQVAYVALDRDENNIPFNTGAADGLYARRLALIEEARVLFESEPYQTEVKEARAALAEEAFADDLRAYVEQTTLSVEFVTGVYDKFAVDHPVDNTAAILTLAVIMHAGPAPK